jgi:Ca2+-binding EF-hand superfamily protein
MTPQEFNEYAALNKFIGQMQSAFYAADADRSGKLTNQEIYNALSTAGFQVSYPTIQAICKKYDAGTGLSLNSFIQICAHLGMYVHVSVY